MTFFLRHATQKDADLLFNWVNDEQVRKSAFNSNLINYEEHIPWFFSKLQSSNSRIYIGCDSDNPIGQIRIDIECENAFIDYSIDKMYRGKGYGVLLLRIVEQQIKDDKYKVNYIMGKVKFENIASRRVFEKVGYTRRDQDNYILYYKPIEENHDE